VTTHWWKPACNHLHSELLSRPHSSPTVGTGCFRSRSVPVVWASMMKMSELPLHYGLVSQCVSHCPTPVSLWDPVPRSAILYLSHWAQCTSQHGSFLSILVAGSPVVQATIEKAAFYFSAFQFCCTIVLFLFTAQIDGHSVSFFFSNFDTPLVFSKGYKITTIIITNGPCYHSGRLWRCRLSILSVPTAYVMRYEKYWKVPSCHLVCELCITGDCRPTA